MRTRHFTPNGPANGNEAGSISWIDSMVRADAVRNGLVIINQALILASGLFRR